MDIIKNSTVDLRVDTAQFAELLVAAKINEIKAKADLLTARVNEIEPGLFEKMKELHTKGWLSCFAQIRALPAYSLLSDLVATATDEERYVVIVPDFEFFYTWNALRTVKGTVSFRLSESSHELLMEAITEDFPEYLDEDMENYELPKDIFEELRVYRHAQVDDDERIFNPAKFSYSFKFDYQKDVENIPEYQEYHNLMAEIKELKQVLSRPDELEKSVRLNLTAAIIEKDEALKALFDAATATSKLLAEKS